MVENYDYKERKVVAVLADDLPVGLAMNALGHMAFSAGRYSDSSMMGEKILKDADGIEHQGICKYPFMVLKATREKIREIIDNSRDLDIMIIDYPQEMFDTDTDQELEAGVSKLTSQNADYHAVLLCGQSKVVNKFTGSLPLYKN